MSNRWALFVAISEYLDPALGGVPYAETTAKAAAELLTAVGYPKANQFVLLGQHATKAAVESRLRRLKQLAKKGDEIIVWVAARGFSRRGVGVIAAWDTLPDDLLDTGVKVAELSATIASSKAAQIVCLYDIGGGALPSDGADSALVPHLDSAELDGLFDDSPKAVCLTATTDEEESHTAAAVKGGVWSHAVLEALAGRAAKAVTADGTVTALSLQRHVEDALPRMLRKHFTTNTVQTPQLFGGQNADRVIADLTPLLGPKTGGLLDPQRLKRVSFRTDTAGRVKDLSGFRKTYKLPDHAGPSSRKFIAKCAIDDVRADLDTVFEACREHLAYKRKDMEATVGSDAFGSLRTPDFEYTVTVELDAADPTQVNWRRELSGLCDIGFVHGAGFRAVFGRTFDQLAFEFAVPVDVTDLVDRLEDAPLTGVKVMVDSDGAECEISLSGFAGAVRVGRNRLTVRGRGANAAGLLDQLLAFVTRVGSLGEPLALPG